MSLQDPQNHLSLLLLAGIYGDLRSESKRNPILGPPTGILAAMLIGFARESTIDQNPALRLDPSQAADVERLYTDRASGLVEKRPELQRALDALQRGTHWSAIGSTGWADRWRDCCGRPRSCWHSLQSVGVGRWG